MLLFITAIGILAASAALCALLAVRPPSKATGRAASLVGVAGAFAGCLAGLCAVASGPWAGYESLRLPLALPIGSCALGMDALSRLFLLPVFGLYPTFQRRFWCLMTSSIPPFTNGLKNFVLDISLMNTNTSSADFTTIKHHIVRLCINSTRIRT